VAPPLAQALAPSALGLAAAPPLASPLAPSSLASMTLRDVTGLPRCLRKP
jgi:hypothetical protein